MGQTTQTETGLVAELNDLLQLDHDAVQAYTLAISSLENPAYKETLHQFRGDHQRHVDELTQLIRARGGIAMELPHLTGAFKLAVQAAGAAGGDRAVLLAFKANERQVRDKYRRSARASHPADVTSVLARAADDEARHYAWVLETLEDLGYDENSVSGRAERAFEVTHKGVADAVEGVERGAMWAFEGARRTLRDPASRKKALGSALLAIGTGVIAARLLGRGRR
jgi:rubrerythrin